MQRVLCSSCVVTLRGHLHSGFRNGLKLPRGSYFQMPLCTGPMQLQLAVLPNCAHVEEPIPRVVEEVIELEPGPSQALSPSTSQCSAIRPDFVYAPNTVWSGIKTFDVPEHLPVYPVHLFNLKRFTKSIRFRTEVHGDLMDLAACVKIALYMHCIKNENDIYGGLNILKYCEDKANGSDSAPAEAMYRLRDLSAVNQLIYSFSLMKTEGFAETMRLTEDLLNFLQKLSCGAKADLVTVYGLFLVLARHPRTLSAKLESDPKEGRLKDLFTRCLISQIKEFLRHESLDLSKILSSRKGKYAIMRDDEDLVIELIEKHFPGVQLEPAAVTNVTETDYYCPELTLLSDLKPADLRSIYCPLSTEQLLQLSEQQRKLEELNSVQLPPVICDDDPEVAIQSKGTLFDYLIKRWKIGLRQGFDVFLKALDAVPEGILLRPFFRVLEPEEYVEIMHDHLLYLITELDPTDMDRGEFKNFFRLICLIKRSVSGYAHKKYKEDEKIFKCYQEFLKCISSEEQLARFPNAQNQRVLFQLSSKEHLGYRFKLRDDLNSLLYWPHGLFVLLGRCLQDLILECAMIFKNSAIANRLLAVENFEALWRQLEQLHYEWALGQLLFCSSNLEMVPALTVQYNRMGESQNRCIKPTAQLMLMLQRTKVTLSYDIITVPMLSPPVPRLHTFFGGNLHRTFVPLLRRNIEHSRAGESKMRMTTDQKLFPVVDALNVLSAVPWKINTRVLDIAITMLKHGCDNEKLVVPPAEENWPAVQHASLRGMISKRLKESATENFSRDPSALRVYAREAQQKLLMNQKLRMRKYILLKKLTLANWLRHSVFWFPCNCDFRGRTYPTSSWFSHIGTDMDRALLLFARGVALGGKQSSICSDLEFDGFQWLKIHLANLHGKQRKKVLTGRLAFVDENMHNVLACAEDPFHNTWWQTFDAPWQALSTVIEISNSVKSGNPAAYVCHFPVHQDGSCNGLQHYSALGRDSEAAREVNVTGSAGPGDIYSRVAELVEEKRALAASCGLEIAKQCEGLVDRSTVKQTVMTTVYGVTILGAARQIRQALRAKKPHAELCLKSASVYLARLTNSSINELLNSSKRIQDWLGEIASCIASDFKEPMQWETPLGMPVVQPYYKNASKYDSEKDVIDETAPADVRRALLTFRSNRRQQPLTKRNMSAIAANFIHSLDSTHMMLTALHCESAGVTFASVHDCYWTHPANVSVMNAICREQFYKMHSLDLLSDVVNYLEKLPKAFKNSSDEKLRNDAKYFLNVLYNRRPAQGNLDLAEVKRTAYFFS